MLPMQQQYTIRLAHARSTMYCIRLVQFNGEHGHLHKEYISYTNIASSLLKMPITCKKDDVSTKRNCYEVRFVHACANSVDQELFFFVCWFTGDDPAIKEAPNS